MTAKEVLTNLKGHENAWDWQKYPLSRQEADVIIPLLEAAADGGKWDMFSETKQSLTKLMDVVRK